MRRSPAPGRLKWATAAGLLCCFGLLGMVDIPLARRTTILPTQLFGPGGLVASPFQFVVTGDDHLEVSSFNSLPGVRLAVHLRFLEEGVTTPQATAIAHTPNTDRTINTTRHALGRGALLNLRVVADAGSPQQGQCFAIVRVIRGQQSNAVALGTLIQGYVTAQQDQAWPGSLLSLSTDGDGFMRMVTGTDQAAGNEWAETVPTGARWELVAAFIQFVAGAAATTRRTGLLFDDGSIVYFRSPSPLTTTAGQTTDHYWAQNAPYTSTILVDASVAHIPPRLFLPAGHRVLSNTNNLQAGDNYGPPRLMVREWVEV